MKGKNGWSGGNGGLAVEPRKQRFGRRSGPRRHPGELRRPRFPPPHSAGDMQPSAPQPLFSRRCLRRFRLANEAAYQLPRSARFDASREVPESLQEGHLRAALSASAVRRRQQGAARFSFSVTELPDWLLEISWRIMVLQEVWLDRVTGRVCMSISAKAMSITGIDDRRYWTWVRTEESRLGSQNLPFFLKLCFVVSCDDARLG